MADIEVLHSTWQPEKEVVGNIDTKQVYACLIFKTLSVYWPV